MTRWWSRGIRPALGAGAVGLAAWPLILSSSYDLRLFTLAGIYALLVLGYQFIFGHAGALALTQGTFFGLGAYITGILGAKLGWTFEGTIVPSIVGPVVLAAIVAAPVLRLESHYFALATLGIAQVMLLVAIKWEPMTGGANGLPGVPAVVVFGAPVPRGWPMALLVWTLVVAGMLFAWQITRGLMGRAFQIMRENDLAAMSIGIDIGALRLVAFLLSAGFGGVAGALYVHTIRVVSPEALEFHVMVACLTLAVVGGRTRIAGANLGAVLLVHLPEWFRFLDKYYLIAYGAVLLGMIIAAPYGLIGLVERARARYLPEAMPRAPEPLPPPIASPAVAHPASGRPLLEIDAVSKSFGGVEALRDVSVSILPREILGLIGPNGSGKTTLINVATGIYWPDAGRVRLEGKDIAGRRPFEIACLGIARTFQNLNLVDDMSALDNVAVARGARRRLGLKRALATPLRDPELARSRREAMHLLDRVGAAAVAMQPAGSLAHGVKRRVEIARALAVEPRILMLDEPAAGLDETEQADLARRLRALAAAGATLLVVEHNMPFLMPLAERIVCLDYGRVIATGTPSEIAANPKVLEAYLGTEEREAENA